MTMSMLRLMMALLLSKITLYWDNVSLGPYTSTIIYALFSFEGQLCSFT